MKSVKLWTSALICALCLCIVVGCGKPSVKKYAVSGTVSTNGSPVNGGVVEFRGNTGLDGSLLSSSAEIQSDGSFALSAGVGLAAGDYSIFFTVSDPSNPMIKNMIESPDTVTVAAGKNIFDLELPEE